MGVLSLSQTFRRLRIDEPKFSSEISWQFCFRHQSQGVSFYDLLQSWCRGEEWDLEEPAAEDFVKRVFAPVVSEMMKKREWKERLEGPTLDLLAEFYWENTEKDFKPIKTALAKLSLAAKARGVSVPADEEIVTYFRRMITNFANMYFFPKETWLSRRVIEYVREALRELGCGGVSVPAAWLDPMTALREIGNRPCNGRPRDGSKAPPGLNFPAKNQVREFVEEIAKIGRGVGPKLLLDENGLKGLIYDIFNLKPQLQTALHDDSRLLDPFAPDDESPPEIDPDLKAKVGEGLDRLIRGDREGAKARQALLALVMHDREGIAISTIAKEFEISNATLQARIRLLTEGVAEWVKDVPLPEVKSLLYEIAHEEMVKKKSNLRN